MLFVIIKHFVMNTALRRGTIGHYFTVICNSYFLTMSKEKSKQWSFEIVIKTKKIFFLL